MAAEEGDHRMVVVVVATMGVVVVELRSSHCGKPGYTRKKLKANSIRKICIIGSALNKRHSIMSLEVQKEKLDSRIDLFKLLHLPIRIQKVLERALDKKMFKYQFVFLRQPARLLEFRVAPIIRYMPLYCTTNCTGEGIEPLARSVRVEPTNHLVHQQRALE